MPLDTLNNVDDSVFHTTSDVYHKDVKTVPVPERNIGIDTKNTLYDNIYMMGTNGQLDVGQVQAFSGVTQSRNSIYQLIDTMCEDAKVAAVLETYVEDATEYNDQGQIVWCESSDANVQKYVSFLLDTINVDKHIYKWAYSLCKYGDVYLRLYRKSDVEPDELFGKKLVKRKKLNEDVKVKVYRKNDHYVNYIEMVPNPAEMFELVRMGKTHAYIKADGKQVANNNLNGVNTTSAVMNYRFNKDDVYIHAATDFVHGALEDNNSRTPETISLFNGEGAQDLTYTVRRGQSLFYNIFKTWRELSLLENSLLLNRVTKSSIVRIISVEVGDMPKEMIGPHLQGIKSLIEQKSALNTGNSLTEYTNPGPIENNIYVPTHNNVGALTTSEIGGNPDVKSIIDIDYYLSQFYGGLRVPKQFFNQTGDSAGFDGGKSLAIISSRYAKMVKRIQNTLCNMIEDAINLLCLDRGLATYVNNFKIRMLAPTTQEEIDRRENSANRIALATDTLNLLSDIDDTTIKLKITKSLLANIINNTEVTSLLDEYINRLEKQQEEEENPVDETETSEEDLDLEMPSEEPVSDDFASPDLDFSGGMDSGSEIIEPVDDMSLPTGEELGVDLTDNSL